MADKDALGLKREAHGHATGHAKTRTYQSWVSMKDRCYRVSHKSFKHYGGCGIQVCERWYASFQNFLADMGKRPEGMSLERMDNNKHYTPSNCKWASVAEQNRNSSRNIILSHNEETMCLKDWAKRLGIDRSALKMRLTKMSITKALSTPKRIYRMKITYKNETLCLKEWADRLGLTVPALRLRLTKMPVERALSVLPSAQHQHKRLSS